MIRRTSIEIDEEKLASVQEVLGTSGLKDTVEKAFDEILRKHLLERLIKRMKTGEGLDLGPEIMEQVRPTR